MRPHPPRSTAGFRSVLVVVLAALLLLAARGSLHASSLRMPTKPEQTPAAPFNALLPIVVGPVASATPSAPSTSVPPAASLTPPATATANRDAPAPTTTPTATTSAPAPNATATQTAAAPGPLQVEAQALYDALYLPALTENASSTGNTANCTPGTITAARLTALEKQVNYFRQMAGVPPITFYAPLNARAQAAALIMAAQGALSHTPPPDWACYSEEGYTGASNSNLGISYGYDTHFSVMNFMEDRGDYNLAVGHREWLLAPPTIHMGGGEVRGPKWDAYAINVVDPGTRYFDPWPATRAEYVAWPPPGYVPHAVVYARWSFFLPNADYAAAGVEMQLDGLPVNAAIIYADTAGKSSALANWSGLVWEPQLDLQALDDATPQRVKVTIRNVQQAGGAPRDFSYDIVLFEPDP